MDFHVGQVFINSDGSKIKVMDVIRVTKWFSQVRFVIIGQESLGEIRIGSGELNLGISLGEIRLDETLTEIEE